MNSQIVANVNGRDVTRGELSEAFNLVVNKTNWKYPVDARVILTPEQRNLVTEAVIFFAGCVPTFEPQGPVFESFNQLVCEYRVRAVGYYNAVGA